MASPTDPALPSWHRDPSWRSRDHRKRAPNTPKSNLGETDQAVIARLQEESLEKERLKKQAPTTSATPQPKSNRQLKRERRAREAAEKEKAALAAQNAENEKSVGMEGPDSPREVEIMDSSDDAQAEAEQLDVDVEDVDAITEKASDVETKDGNAQVVATPRADVLAVVMAIGVFAVIGAGVVTVIGAVVMAFIVALLVAIMAAVFVSAMAVVVMAFAGTFAVGVVVGMVVNSRGDSRAGGRDDCGDTHNAT